MCRRPVLRLLLGCIDFNDETKSLVLNRLMAVSEDRQVPMVPMVPMDPMAIRSDQLRELWQREYPQLVALVDGKPPTLKDAYGRVQALYESLPWPLARTRNAADARPG